MLSANATTPTLEKIFKDSIGAGSKVERSCAPGAKTPNFREFGVPLSEAAFIELVLKACRMKKRSGELVRTHNLLRR